MSSGRSPTDVVRAWVECFNAADVEGLVALYAEDAVNDQVVLAEPLRGREAIRRLFETEFARAAMTCIVEALYESGATAILQWRDPNGLQGCGFFDVRDGLIVHQRGYFDQLSFFKAQGLAVPHDYLGWQADYADSDKQR